MTARSILAAIAALSLCALAAVVAIGPPLVSETPPDEPQQMAAWLARHPADWLTAARLTEASLDTEHAARFRAWNMLHAHVRHLAPNLANADAAFVRGGLFHWYELSARDRQSVLAAAARLSTDPAVFAQLYEPLWQLTRDFAALRRMSPKTLNAAALLKKTAIENGLFNEYRDLRAEERRHRLARAQQLAASGSAAELMALLPPRLRGNDQPVVDLALATFASHASPAHPVRVPDGLIEYVVRHPTTAASALRGLLGDSSYPAILRARLALAIGAADAATQIETGHANAASPEWIDYFLERAIVEAHARRAVEADAYLTKATAGGLTPALLRAAAETARLLGRPAEARRYLAQLRGMADAPRWRGSCGDAEICGSALLELVDSRQPLGLHLAVVHTDEVSPYVEVFIDDVLTDEAPVDDEWRFVVPAGARRVEIRVANPVMPNGVQRRLRVS